VTKLGLVTMQPVLVSEGPNYRRQQRLIRKTSYECPETDAIIVSGENRR